MFTVHGLSRIYTGNTTEKFFWSIFVILALVINDIVLIGYMSRYQKYGVYQDVSCTPTTKAFYPQLTFCLSDRKDALKHLKRKTLGESNPF